MIAFEKCSSIKITDSYYQKLHLESVITL